MSTATQKSVYYRRARFTESMSRSLQQMLSEAVTMQDHIRDRLETMDSAATEFRVISACKQEGSFLCGRLTTFERGGFQLVIADDPDAKSLPLSAIEPPNQDGVPHQFATGILYFCIFQNHIAVIQSTALKAGAFEQHLAWLLRAKTSVLAPEQGVALSDEPQQATRDRIKKSHVKSVKLGRPFMDETVLASTEQAHGTSQTKFKPSGPLVTMIKEWIDPTQFERLGLEEGVFDGNLEVWIEIRYPKRLRTRPEDSVRLLDDLAIALRDMDEDQARLELADGTVVTGNQLKITGRIDVKMSAGLLDESDLYTNMREWLETLIRDGVIAD